MIWAILGIAGGAVFGIGVAGAALSVVLKVLGDDVPPETAAGE